MTTDNNRRIMTDDDNIISDNSRPSARDAIAAGLAALPPSRRRLESIGAAWKRDGRYERMRVLHEADPERFLRTFGSAGLVQIGLYESGRRAAAGLDGPDEDEAA